MPKIAIDVVLLLPEKIMNKAISINSKLDNDSIRLNKKDCIPHISLCIGVIDSNNLPKIRFILEKIAKKNLKLHLTINKATGQPACFKIIRANQIQRLHEPIMTKLIHFLSFNATNKMFISPPVINKNTIDWVINTN